MVHLQETFSDWANRTYPRATPLSIAKAIQREANKLVEGIEKHGGANTEEECADILLLLFHMARKCRFSVYAAGTQKFTVLKVRSFPPLPVEEEGEHDGRNDDVFDQEYRKTGPKSPRTRQRVHGG